MDKELDKLGESLAKLPLKEQTFTRKKEIEEILIKNIKAHQEKEARKKKLIIQTMSIAAAMVFIVIIFTWKLSEQTYEVSTGELSFNLPDGSSVNLGENSQIIYNTFLWHFNRNISLKGSASFYVTKGKKFTVKTKIGNISVLGTKFYVNQRGDNLDVKCYEGSVKVEANCGTAILKKGERSSCESGSLLNIEKIKDKPQTNLFHYDNTPVIDIMREIEALYHVTINQIQLCENLTFTGTLPTDNLEVALKVLLSSCNINYKISKNSITLNK